MMSLGMYLTCTFAYSGCSIGDARKKYLRSALQNFAPLLASDITLFSINLVSVRSVVGADASSSNISLSPPTTILHRRCSVFSGR